MLKVQLKKYVGAVQMLKREGQTAEGEGETAGGEGPRLVSNLCAWCSVDTEYMMGDLQMDY